MTNQSGDPQELYTREEFARVLRQQYVELEGIKDDDALIRATLETFPEYKNWLVPEPVKQPEPKAEVPDRDEWWRIESAEEVQEDDWAITEMAKEAGRIWNRSMASSEMGQLLTDSMLGGEIDFDELMYYQDVLKENERDADKDILTVEDGRNEILKFVVDLAATLPESLISQFNSMLDDKSAAAATAGAGIGAGIGAGVGAFAGGVGAAPGAIAGGKIGLISGSSGMASFMNTYGSELMGELQKAGVDINDAEAVKNAFNNEELFTKANDTALIKSGIVGGIDAISAGAAGAIGAGSFLTKVVSGMSKKPMKVATERAVKEFGEYALEGSLGGLGEGLGQWASGQEMNWRDIALEALADPAQGYGGRAMKTVLGDRTSENENIIIDELEVRPEETKSVINQAKIENSESLNEINENVSKLKSSLKNTESKEGKRAIKEQINELQAKKNEIYVEAINESKEIDPAEMQEISKLTDDALNLLKAAQSEKISVDEKKVLEKSAEAKAKQVVEKKKEARAKINVSGRNFDKTPAPAPTEAPAQPDAAENFLASLDEEVDVADTEEVTTENVPPELMIQKRVDSKGRDVETFINESPDGNITEYTSYANGQELPVGGIVFNDNQKKSKINDFFDKFSISEKDKNDLKSAGVQEILLMKSELIDLTGSETFVDKHSVKYRNAEGKLVDADLYSKSSALNLEGFEAYAEAERTATPAETPTESQTTQLVEYRNNKYIVSSVDGKPVIKNEKTGKEISVKGGYGKAILKNVESSVMETPVEENQQDMEAARVQVAKAVSEQLSALTPAIEELKAAILEEASNGQDVTVLEEQLESLEKKRKDSEKNFKDAEPTTDEIADNLDAVLPELPFEEQVKKVEQKVAPVNTGKKIKKVKNALFKVNDKADPQTKEKANDALTEALRASSSNDEALSRFLAENAERGDEVLIGGALFRVEEATEDKGESLLSQDISNLNALNKFSPGENLKESLNRAYRAVVKKNSIRKLNPEAEVELGGKKFTAGEALAVIDELETVLGQFERGRYKSAKNKDYNISNVLTLLEAIQMTNRSDAKSVYGILNSLGNSVEHQNVKAELKKLWKEEGADSKELGKYWSLKRKEKKFNRSISLASEMSTNPKLKKLLSEGSDLIQSLNDAGFETNLGNGLTRSVKMVRINRRTGMPFSKKEKAKKKTASRQADFTSELVALQRKEKGEGLTTEERERLDTLLSIESGSRRRNLSKAAKERQQRLEVPYAYTASVKDGNLTKIRYIDALIDNAKDGVLYTRFKPELSEEKKAINAALEKYEKGRGYRGTIVQKSKDKDGNPVESKYNISTYRPKGEKSLVGSLEKVFNLSSFQSKPTAKIIDRLIENMARRSKSKKSDIYNKITFVEGATPTSRTIGSLIKLNGLPISTSNIDPETGAALDYDKYDQKANPPAIKIKGSKFERNGITDPYVAQTVEDLVKEGLDVMNMKGEALNNLMDEAGELTEILKEKVADSSISTDRADIENNKGLYAIFLTDIATARGIDDRNLITEDIIVEEEMREGRSRLDMMEDIANNINSSQTKILDQWIQWFDETTMSEDPVLISKAFQLVKTVMNGNYDSVIPRNGELVPNKKNTLKNRNKSTTDNPNPFVPSIADRIIENEITEHPIVAYTNELKNSKPEFIDGKVSQKNNDGTQWVMFNSLKGLSVDEARAEADALSACVSDSFWCTRYLAHKHLEGGNFHVLLDKDLNPITAIREEYGKIAEVRGNTPMQIKIPEYEGQLNSYLSTGKVAGATTEVAAKDILERSEFYASNPDAAIENVLDAKGFLEMLSGSPDQAGFDSFIEKGGADILGVAPSEIFVEGVSNPVETIDTEDYKVVVVRDSNVTISSIESIELSQLMITGSGSVTIDTSRDFDTDNISVNNVDNISNSGGIKLKVKPRGESMFGLVTYVALGGNVGNVRVAENAGAIEVRQLPNTTIESILFEDNFGGDVIYKDIKQARTTGDNPRTIPAQSFDINGIFEDILYQQTRGQQERQNFINRINQSNRFKTKKEAQQYIKDVREDYPNVQLSVVSRMGLAGDPDMKWRIRAEVKKTKAASEKIETSNEAQAAIALVHGQALIFALTNPNVSSPVHEMAHMYEDYLTADEIKVLEKWSGFKRDFNNPEQKVEFSEAFARGFERYLADGKAPTPELKSIFAKFKEWMKSIYKAIKGSDIDVDITPEVRKIFDTMVMVEGDVNFDKMAAEGDAVGGKYDRKVLEQRNGKSYTEAESKFEQMQSGSENKILAANEGNKKSVVERIKKQWSDRQSNIRKKLIEADALVAESAMTGRAGGIARGMGMASKWESQIYNNLDIDTERTLNKFLQAERIVQIENNREAKRDFALSKLEELESRRAAILEAGVGIKLNDEQRKVVNDSLKKIAEVSRRYQKMYNDNRLYNIDENGNETNDLAFKHPKGITKQEAMDYISSVSNRKDYQVIKERADIFFDAMSENLKDMYDNGIINEETYNRFKNDKYISRQFLSHLFDFQYDTEGQVMKVDYEKNADFYAEVGLNEGIIKSLEEGSEGDLITDSRYLLEAAFKATSIRVTKNRANKALGETLGNKNLSWYREANYETDLGKVVEDAYGNKKVLGADKGFKNVFYRDNGKLKAFQLDNESFNEWNDLERKSSMPDGVKTIKKLSGVGVLKAMATGYNPLFFLANVPMDMAHVLFFTDVYDSNKLLPVNFIKATKGFMKNTVGLVRADAGVDTKSSKLLDIYIDNGGMMDFMTQQGQETLAGGAKNLKGISKRSQLKEKAAKVLGYTGNITELAMRLTSMENVINNLKSQRKAGKNTYTDAEINQIAVAKARKTMDFAQGGLAAKQVDNFVPYFNAAVQGFRVSREYLSTKSGRANFANKWMQASVAVSGLVFYNLMQGEDEDDNPIDDVPDYILDNYFVILNPFSSRDEEGRVSYIRLRKTPTLAPFLNLSESIARATYYAATGKEDPKGHKTTEEQFKRALKSIETTLPFVPSAQGIVSKLPPTVQGSIKYISNYDPFRQMNIVPKNEIDEIMPMSEGMADERVPLFMKALGKVFNMSPKRGQAAMESVITSPSTNGMVAMGYAAADLATSVFFKPNEIEKSRYSGGLLKGLQGAAKSSLERVYRKTNPNWRDYKYEEAQQIRMEEGSLRYEVKKHTDFFAKNKDVEGFRDYMKTVELNADKKYAFERFKMYMKRDGKVKNLSKSLDVIYTRDPEASAKIFGEYFGVYDLRKESEVNKLKKELAILRKNYDWKAGNRWREQYIKLSKSKYNY